MRLTNYFTVNGGVLLVAGLVAQLDAAALAATDRALLAALASTALLYALVFAACAVPPSPAAVHAQHALDPTHAPLRSGTCLLAPMRNALPKQ